MANLRCVEPFAYQEGEVQRVVRAGDIVDEKDPAVTPGRRQWFEPVDVSAERFTDRRVYERTSGPPGSKAAARKATAAKKAASSED